MVYYLFATFNISWIRYMLNEKGLQFKLVAVRKCLNAMTRMTWWWIQVQLNVCLFFYGIHLRLSLSNNNTKIKIFTPILVGLLVGSQDLFQQTLNISYRFFFFIENLVVWCQMGLSDATWHIFPEIDKKNCWCQQKYHTEGAQLHNIWKQQHSFLMRGYSSKSDKWFKK